MIPTTNVLLQPDLEDDCLDGGEVPPPEEPVGSSSANNGGVDCRNFAWRRWTARVIDLSLGYFLSIVFFFTLGLLSGMTNIGLGFWSWLARPENAACDLILTTAASYFSAALVYALFGNTLGKKICGIRVCDGVGRRPDARAFLKREFAAFVWGNGCCLPLLTLIGQVVQYNRVCKGIPTSYDANKEFQAYPTRGPAWFDTPLVILLIVLAVVVKMVD